MYFVLLELVKLTLWCVGVVLLVNSAPNRWYHEIFRAVRVGDDAFEFVSLRLCVCSVCSMNTFLMLAKPGYVLSPNPPSDVCSIP